MLKKVEVIEKKKKELFEAYLQEFLNSVIKDKKYKAVRLNTRSYPYFRMLREKFYNNGNKIIPRKLLENRFLDKIIAYWFMDDGYTNIRKNRKPISEICIYGFSQDDQKWITNLLNINKFACSLKEKRIRFNTEQTDYLFYRISKYIPKAMEYKIPPYKRTFIKKILKPKQEIFYDIPIINLEKKQISNKNLYCLDIEDVHNFVTVGGVVHNCKPPENRDPTPDELFWCYDYLTEQINYIKPRIIVTLGRIALWVLIVRKDLDFENPSLTMMGPIKQYRDKVHKINIEDHTYRAIAMYHPSYWLRRRKDIKEIVDPDFQLLKYALLGSILNDNRKNT